MMSFVFDTIIKVIFIQIGYIIGAYLVPIILQSFIGIAY